MSEAVKLTYDVSADDFKNGITYVDIMQKNKKALERGICP